jgi:hypothetical protein
MPSPVETAVDTYIRAVSEPDPALRREMLDACFAADARFVTRSGELRGPAAIAEMVTRGLADPQVLGVRVVAIDARGTTFRFQALTLLRNGQSLEVFDAGEIDAAGRIRLLLTFAGPLGKPAEPAPVEA